ncbi:potassium voltage-gated channel subfamily C member 1-like [Megalops cyprinoides]|uniref:potassium voltage-gated channel subfamily C member 1-like n=1 Tax=Megalops cyprinoides TaxID=118141 RepID=UPI0018650A88|nr:potassium voltage-gated channel subfamily C member 1-like [Megalops cyprinoides]
MLKEEMARSEDREKIVINVGGTRHETFRSTLQTLPGTRLANLCTSSSNNKELENEMFFDRHPGIFVHILNYYRTGKLHRPADVCGGQFEEELAFWGIDEVDMEACCWVKYCQHRDTKAALHQLGPPHLEDVRRDRGGPATFGIEDGQNRSQNFGMWQQKIWALLDDPQSSGVAMAVGVLSLIIIVVSIINMCLETYQHFHGLEHRYHLWNETELWETMSFKSTPAFTIVEAVCTALFTLEFLGRFICCPNKLLFIRDPLNIVDFVALLPLYLEAGLGGLSGRSALDLLRVVRFVRLLRIFKVTQHVAPLQILHHTLRSSLPDICFLFSLLALASFMFGSLTLYAEGLTTDFDDTQFRTISDGAWFAVISLTTIGYGDVYPVSRQGKIAAAVCAMFGVLAFALPVPAMVNNYKKYHTLVVAKLHMRKRQQNPNLRAPVELSPGDLDRPEPYAASFGPY